MLINNHACKDVKQMYTTLATKLSSKIHSSPLVQLHCLLLSAYDMWKASRAEDIFQSPEIKAGLHRSSILEYQNHSLLPS